MMRLNTGLHDEPELDPSTNFSRQSQPSIRTDLSPNVIGVLGKEVRLACYLTNLGNKTVAYLIRTIFVELHGLFIIKLDENYYGSTILLTNSYFRFHG